MLHDKSQGHVLRVVDSHTCGQPTRVIVSGTGVADGTSPLTAQRELRERCDWIRRITVLEPRGHRSMLAEEGLIRVPSPDFCGPMELGLLTPAGRVALRAQVENGRVESVAFRTPIAFYLGSMQAQIGGRTQVVDLAYGGQWYAFVDLANSGLHVDANDIDELISMGAKARREIERTIRMDDPMTGRPPHPINVVWVDAPRHPAAQARNVPISPAGSFDRSPCGTATCARMATLVAQGKLMIGGQFINEGLLGTVYRGIAVSAITHLGIDGIVPEVEGSAWITGRMDLSVDPRDPLGNGYLVGGAVPIL